MFVTIASACRRYMQGIIPELPDTGGCMLHPDCRSPSSSISWQQGQHLLAGGHLLQYSMADQDDGCRAPFPAARQQRQHE